MLAALLAAALAIAAPTTAARATPAAGSHVAARPAAWHPAVPFLEDDYTRAVALARERKLPLFIDGWAPW